jgi:hypothetical protein
VQIGLFFGSPYGMIRLSPRNADFPSKISLAFRPRIFNLNQNATQKAKGEIDALYLTFFVFVFV